VKSRRERRGGDERVKKRWDARVTSGLSNTFMPTTHSTCTQSVDHVMQPFTHSDSLTLLLIIVGDQNGIRETLSRSRISASDTPV
jgi:hypothetical protein